MDFNNEEDRIKIGKQARNSVKKYTSDIVGEEWITLYVCVYLDK